MRPVHSGGVLRDELDALGLSGKALGVLANRITMILNGQLAVGADTALRLNLQKTWELCRAEIETGREVAERVTPRQSAA